MSTPPEQLAQPLNIPQPLNVAVVDTPAGDPSAIDVRLRRSAALPTGDQALWVAIRNGANAIGFNAYHDFINRVLCEPACEPSGAYTQIPGECGFGSPSVKQQRAELDQRPTIHGVDAYNLLKLATEAFLVFQCGLVRRDGTILPRDPAGGTETAEAAESRRLGRTVDEPEIIAVLQTYLGGSASSTPLPYLRRIVTQIVGLDAQRRSERLPYCEAILKNRLTCPSLIELIWSYWHEEGMLVQTINALALRFQNRRLGARDPLVNLELDPLRPLNNLFWGLIQDQYSLLSVQRRAYEYDHHYGISLYGKAVSRLDSADSRSKFVEAFHNLLYRTAMYYREDDDTTVIADAFPLLNALREVHLLLAEGAHNQFGDLPWTARREMLMMQWLLARPEIKEFLRGRYMVPYQEPWMGAVDDMKRLQGWTDTTITHFRELAVYGEQILLAVRYGDWIDVNDQEQARNWARYWRPEIQRYIHAYMAVTGVDLAAEITDVRRASERFLPPSVHLQNRLAAQHSSMGLPAPVPASGLWTAKISGDKELQPALRRRLLRHRSDEQF